MNTKWHSFRLTVHDSGRVRWCIGNQMQWQTILKKLVIVPAILLTMIIIYLVATHHILKKNNTENENEDGKRLSERSITYFGNYSDLLNIFETSYIVNNKIESSEEDSSETPSPDMLQSDTLLSEMFPSETLLSDMFPPEMVPSETPLPETVSSETPLPEMFSSETPLPETLPIAIERRKRHTLKIKEAVVNDGKKRRVHNIGIDLAEDVGDNRNFADDIITFPQTFWKEKLLPVEIRQIQANTMKHFMDTEINPCNDFYQYACGNWPKYNPIPPDRAGYDTFELLRESLDYVLKDLLEDKEVHDQYFPINYIPSDEEMDTKEKRYNSNLVTNHTNNTVEMDVLVKAKFLYKSCMNAEIINQRGAVPLLDLLDNFGGWPMLNHNWKEETFDLVKIMGMLRLYNNDILISEWIGPDIKNSDEYVIQIDQTTLGLPTREYFLESSNKKYIEAYRMYMITIATLLGAPTVSATADAYDIVEFEVQLANIIAPPENRRNVSQIYNRVTIRELQLHVPQIDWLKYMNIVMERHMLDTEPIVCYCWSYLQQLVKLLTETPPRTVANYLLWRFIRHRVNNLDDRFEQAKQRFYKVLFGREKPPPRWQSCVSQVNSNLGMALGRMFVEKYFDETSKNDTITMTKSLQKAFKHILKHTDWLDEGTKKLALLKINAMGLRIGYPDFILNSTELSLRYEDVIIHPDYYFENTLSILQHLTRVEQKRLGTIVNKILWNTAPAVVNAYYSRNKNQIMFPAGILQPPFYHRYFPKCLNYGGIGVVIGHEITHGFDDKGRLFDREGNLQKWWTEKSIDEFHQRTQCLIDQYNNYIVPEINLQVDGTNTQGENIADNGGIKQAYRAYLQWLTENPDADESLPDLNVTNKQLFFLNFAQVWCGNARPEAAKNKLKIAVHSPGRFRVIGALSNSEDFADVYSCPLGSPMNPVKKCRIW